MPASTFPGALSARLRADAVRPLVTFYDDQTGERVELSVATYANWVAKTAGLVQDELDVEPGGVVLLDLPTHWQGAVWLGAAWSANLCATDDLASVATADLVVCGPGRVTEYAGLAAQTPVVALSLRPLGGRFAEPLPPHVVDYASVLAQPDVFMAADPPAPDDLAWRDAAGPLGHADLVRGRQTGRSLPADLGRLLTDVNPCSRAGLDSLVGPLLAGGGTIWVANADPAGWQHKYDQEGATSQRVVGAARA